MKNENILLIVLFLLSIIFLFMVFYFYSGEGDFFGEGGFVDNLFSREYSGDEIYGGGCEGGSCVSGGLGVSGGGGSGGGSGDSESQQDVLVEDEIDFENSECGFYFRSYGICNGTCPSGSCMQDEGSCYCQEN
jgi:hypothetical protein